MSNFDEIAKSSSVLEEEELEKEKFEKKGPLDIFTLAITTFGVGYLPLAPGTFGSIIGVLIYLAVAWAEANVRIAFLIDGVWRVEQVSAWFISLNLAAFTLFCLVGIWASHRAVALFRDKDPQKVVIDEVIGQLLVFLFVPFLLSGWLILAGFLLFRLFDIWKPYPIDSLQNLPAGIGVCADDILAGVYGGVCLSIIYAVSLSF